MKLLSQNSALRHASKLTGERVMNFGIPALETPEGKRTCPFAGACQQYCYAKRGAYLWSNVAPVYRKRYEATLRPDFPTLMLKEIQERKPTYLRVHDAGDWYSREYRDKWFHVIENSPHVRFYTYTKSVPLFKEVLHIPDNLSVVFSLGGTRDDLVDLTKDRHARIFDSVEALEAAGYVNASANDLLACRWRNPDHRVGLVWNGPNRSKALAQNA